jgi:hypothetical protein
LAAGFCFGLSGWADSGCTDSFCCGIASSPKK